MSNKLQPQAMEELKQIAQEYENLPVEDSVFILLKSSVRKILKANKGESDAIVDYMDKNFRGATLINLKGIIASDLGLSSTEEIFKNALFESKRNNDLNNQKRAHYYLGHYYGKIANYVEAELEFNKAAIIYKQQNKLRSLSGIYISLSDNALANYQKDNAKKYISKLLPILEKFPEDRVLRRRYYSSLSSFYEYNGEYNKSLVYNDSLLFFCSPDITDAYLYNRALLLLYQGYHRKAARFVDKSIKFYKENDEIIQLGNAYLVSAECYRKMGVYDTAMIQCNNAWEYLSNSKNRLCHLRSEISKIEFAMGNTTKGKEEGLEAVTCFDETSNENSFYQLFNKYSWKSTYYENINELDKAVHLLDSCYILAKENGIKDNLSSVLNQRGGIYLKQGKLLEAEQEFKRALQSAEAIGLLTERANSLLLLADLELTKKNYAQAEKYIVQSSKQTQEIDYVGIMEKVLEVSIAIAEKQGDFEKAYIKQIELTTLRDSLRSYAVNNIVLKYDTELEVADYKEKKIVLENIKQEQEVKIIKSKKVIIVCISLLLILLIVVFVKSRSVKSRIRNEFRKEISRDVHDDIGGILLNLVRTVNLAAMEEDFREKDRALFAQISELSNSAMLSFRDILWKTDVDPIAVSDFQKIISDFTQNKFGTFFQKGMIDFSMSDFDNERLMDNEVAYHSLMIYKAAMQNILKHNNECEVKIDWKFDKESIKFLVKNSIDNKVTSINSIKSRGIDYMKERVKLLNGTVDFNTSDDSYSVEVFIPC